MRVTWGLRRTRDKIDKSRIPKETFNVFIFSRYIFQRELSELMPDNRKRTVCTPPFQTTLQREYRVHWLTPFFITGSARLLLDLLNRLVNIFFGRVVGDF